MTKAAFALLFTLIVSLQSLAASAAPSGLRLFAWTAHPDTPSYVIPVRKNETPDAAAKRYLSRLKSTPELMVLFPNGLPSFDFQKFEPISESRFESQSLLLANRDKDYDTRSSRILNFSKLYESATERIRTTSYMLPIKADLGLSESEAFELRVLIRRSFGMMTAMGGHDNDPKLYGEEITHSKMVVPMRDRFEIELIKDYTTYGEGFMVGVCRGHQLTSIALGYKLIQDLPAQAPSDIEHADGHHDIHLLQTPSRLLTRATGSEMIVNVNTLHHQAVVYREGGPMIPAAYGPDGVIEALEFKNGRGFTLQFHPELMDNNLGRNVMHELVRAKNRTIRRACGQLFKAAS